MSSTNNTTTNQNASEAKSNVTKSKESIKSIGQKLKGAGEEVQSILKTFELNAFIKSLSESLYQYRFLILCIPIAFILMIIELEYSILSQSLRGIPTFFSSLKNSRERKRIIFPGITILIIVIAILYSLYKSYGNVLTLLSRKL